MALDGARRSVNIAELRLGVCVAFVADAFTVRALHTCTRKEAWMEWMLQGYDFASSGKAAKAMLEPVVTTPKIIAIASSMDTFIFWVETRDPVVR
eukprot:CAMPEP_0167796730 /NCGR_PEP_ID=MMETSP0111_2-20121227/15224_1 /TAXON_ID=91324 /ORGANISM="Lotharella globosa, Strain CCCM811" /LENGTH=94 /DNA_ID=CAMNT_0007690683 /DNA_START=72 /DNA_END=357 /DNA_ORIENTATION=+